MCSSDEYTVRAHVELITLLILTVYEGKVSTLCLARHLLTLVIKNFSFVEHKSVDGLHDMIKESFAFLCLFFSIS